ncbi:hypothetical protein [Burkholderia dolosa]|uniref:hypothetical protein n=1 Tax=Burkholderia dolosa TaxID=152500 RepID=UPI001BA01B66|nr:hypothetical protein [Burkholderia dolosa]MBR8059749.1 hypothetical protein [Burkholderia dolosa]
MKDVKRGQEAERAGAEAGRYLLRSARAARASIADFLRAEPAWRSNVHDFPTERCVTHRASGNFDRLCASSSDRCARVPHDS